MTKPFWKLPLREAVGETLWSGCSKQNSHRALPEFTRFEIPYKFPRFPQIWGYSIVRRIKKKEKGREWGHPCTRHFDTVMDCLRRHPDTYDKKCRIEVGRCLACLEQHKNWKADMGYSYLRFLEHFRVFTQGRQSLDEGTGKFQYKDPTPGTDGAGTVLQFKTMVGVADSAKGKKGSSS
mmetsp:Transcript_51538/g.95337  ORF Transcript_51538/g.95337 Transcript_51538/m.95337 type:complete len:179 (-) Transcript_51538:12-548(-)